MTQCYKEHLYGTFPGDPSTSFRMTFCVCQHTTSYFFLTNNHKKNFQTTLFLILKLRPPKLVCLKYASQLKIVRQPHQGVARCYPTATSERWRGWVGYLPLYFNARSEASEHAFARRVIPRQDPSTSISALRRPANGCCTLSNTFFAWCHFLSFSTATRPLLHTVAPPFQHHNNSSRMEFATYALSAGMRMCPPTFSRKPSANSFVAAGKNSPKGLP